MMWSSNKFAVVIVGGLSIMMGIMTIVVEIPIQKDMDIWEDTSYNMIEVKAPVLTGWKLAMFTKVLAGRSSPLRPFIIRYLLNKNGIHLIREMAASMPKTTSRPTHYPMTRLSAEEYMYHTTKATEHFNQDVLINGLPPTGDVSSNPTSPSQTTRYRTIMDYHTLYQTHQATPSKVINEVLIGIEQLNPRLHMMKDFYPNQIRQQAKESTQRWNSNESLSIFDGIPIAFKDQVDIKGHQNCLGSQFCHVATSDDVLVETFRRGGAIILGTTVMTEGGVTPLGYSLWNDGPFNPFDTNYYSGGSSSGSAVLVASGITPVTIGFDGGGSIRIPASMSGVMGLASTFGRIETSSGLHSTNVKCGPIGASVDDVAITHVYLNSIVNKTHYYSQLYDGGVRGVPPAHLDGYYLPGSTSSTDNDTPSLPRSLRGMKVGIYWDHFHHSDPEVVRKCQDVVQYMVDKLGVSLVNITIPHLRQIHLSHGIKILSEFATSWDSQFYANEKQLEGNTLITLLMGKSLTANEVLAAEKIRTWSMMYMSKEIWSNVDVIVSPTLGTTVPKLPHNIQQKGGESNTPLVYKVMRFVSIANFCGYPSMSLPIGYEFSTGLPIGFQITANAWNEHLILKMASVLEHTYIQPRRKLPPSKNVFDPLQKWLSS